jgi:quercetin dioxygenase-like cupin family protein
MSNQPAFTGDTTLERIADLPALPVAVNRVSFPDGSVTHWHSHEGGQVLQVVSGDGRYQERGGTVRPLRPGDTVVVAAGVEHWHGAAPDRDMVHIAFSSGTSTWGDAPETEAGIG